MKKSSLFTLFVAAIFVVIVAEMMVDGYLQAPAKTEVATNVLAPTPIAPVVPAVAGSGTITTSLLAKAGLQGYKLNQVAYAGKLLDQIDFAPLSGVPIFESHLMKSDIVQVASFYELDATNNEVYDFIKLKCAAEPGAILNETNTFGDASFYVNYYDIPQKVFLVLRKGSRVFALTYNKEMHTEMTNLMGLL